MEQQDDDDDDDYSINDKIYLYLKDSNKAKHQYLSKNCENIGLENLKDKKAFIELSNGMKDVYTIVEENSPYKIKRKMQFINSL